MPRSELPTIRFHEDVTLFREAVNFTAAQTAFAAGLIEKDYFCTLLLAYLQGRPARVLYSRAVPAWPR